MNIKYFIFLMLLSILSYSQTSDWYTVNPLPQSNLNGIFFIDKNTGYVIGDNKLIIKTTTGSDDWVSQEIGISNNINLKGIYFFNANSGFISGDLGVIASTTNGGNNWYVINTSVTQSINKIIFINTVTGYAAGSNGIFLKTTNGGYNWNSSIIGSVGLNSIYFVNSSTGYIAGDSGKYYITTNSGANWEQNTLGNASLRCVYFTNQNTGYIVSYSQYSSSFAYRTTNAGIKWDTIVFFRISSNWNSVRFIDQNTGFISGERNLVMKTVNGGLNWIEMGVSARTILKDISTADTFAYICGSNGWISKISQSGYFKSLGGTKEDFTSISFLNQNTGIVIGGYECIKTSNSGVNWNFDMVGTLSWEEGHTTYPTDVFYKNPGTVYLKLHYQPAGWHPSDELIKSTNNGNDWTGIFYSYGPTLIEGFDEINGVEYISAISGAKFIFRNSGSGWDTCFYSTTIFPGEISFANSNTGLAVINNSNLPRGFLKTTNGGNSWETVTTGNNKKIEGLKLLASGTGYIAGDSGFFMKTTNFGTNWQLINSEINTYFNSLRFVDDDNGWLLYSSGNWPQSYRLYFTRNGGLNFYPITSLGSFNVKAFSFIDANTGFVAGDSGVVLKTTNGGLTFVNQTGELFPDNYSFSQNYPNPFNPVTNIRFDIPKSGFVKIIVYDLLGREITQLVNQQMQPGSYSVDWDASSYPSGVYFYSIEAGDYKETRKMVLVK